MTPTIILEKKRMERYKPILLNILIGHSRITILVSAKGK